MDYYWLLALCERVIIIVILWPKLCHADRRKLGLVFFLPTYTASLLCVYLTIFGRTLFYAIQTLCRKLTCCLVLNVKKQWTRYSDTNNCNCLLHWDVNRGFAIMMEVEHFAEVILQGNFFHELEVLNSVHILMEICYQRCKWWDHLIYYP